MRLDPKGALLAALAESPDGLLVEDLLCRAGERSARQRLLAALRQLASAGQLRIERDRSDNHELCPPVVRPAATPNTPPASRRARLLAALAEHPGGVCADTVLCKAGPPSERQGLAARLNIMARQGEVRISGRTRRNRIASALVELSTGGCVAQ